MNLYELLLMDENIDKMQIMRSVDMPVAAGALEILCELLKKLISVVDPDVKGTVNSDEMHKEQPGIDEEIEREYIEAIKSLCYAQYAVTHGVRDFSLHEILSYLKKLENFCSSRKFAF